MPGGAPSPQRGNPLGGRFAGRDSAREADPVTGEFVFLCGIKYMMIYRYVVLYIYIHCTIYIYTYISYYVYINIDDYIYIYRYRILYNLYILYTYIRVNQDD